MCFFPSIEETAPAGMKSGTFSDASLYNPYFWVFRSVKPKYVTMTTGINPTEGLMESDGENRMSQNVPYMLTETINTH